MNTKPTKTQALIERQVKAAMAALLRATEHTSTKKDPEGVMRAVVLAVRATK